jgi:hypothetical protein
MLQLFFRDVALALHLTGLSQSLRVDSSPRAPEVELASFFTDLRRQLQRQRLLREGGYWLASSAGSFFCLLALFPIEIQHASTVAKLLFALFSLVSIGTAAWLILRRKPTDSELARFVATYDPARGRALLSAVELTAELTRRPGAFSAALVETFLKQVRQQTESLDPVALARQRSTTIGLGATGVVTACALLGLLWHPERFARGFGLLLGRTSIETVDEPLVADLEVRLQFPTWAHRAPETMTSSSGGVVAPFGTEVALSTRALVGADRAQLILEEGDARREVPVEVEDGHLKAGFQVHQNGRYRFVIASHGRWLMEKEPHPVALEHNQPPHVTLRAPADALELERSRPVELDWSAEEDTGLSRVELVWRVDHGPEQRQLLFSTDPSAPSIRAQKGRFVWNLAELPPPPGRAETRIAYHIEALDFATPVEVGRSRALSITISPLREKLVRLRDLTHARNRLQALMRQYKTAPSPELRRQIEDALRALERKLAMLKSRDPADERPDHGLGQAMEKSGRDPQLDHLRSLLAQGDLEGAAAEMESFSSSLDRMVSAMERGLRSAGGARATKEERARAALENALADVEHEEKQLHEDTQSLRRRFDERRSSHPSPESGPVPKQSAIPGERREIGELIRRQERTRKRATGLREKIGASSDAGGLPIGSGLKKATSHMEGAEAHLRRGDSRGAQGEEEEALTQLAEMRRQLAEERRRDQETGWSQDQEPVRIPGADEYKVPTRFRQDLLDAMKRPAPNEYRERVKRYFEELTR